MSRDGNGVYSLPVNSWNPAIDGNAATTVDWQDLINDVAASITQSVSSDGQTPMTGDLNMNGNKIESLAAGTASTDGATVSQIYSQGEEVTVASAATTDIGVINSNFINITGTTTITSFGTNYNGPRFIRFSGVLTLTYNGTSLILPSAQNITTASGDTAIFVPKGVPSNGWICVYYQGASTTLRVGRGNVPTNTTAIIDRLNPSTIPALSVGTVLTLASSSGSGSDAHLQLIADTNANATIRFGDSASANMARLDYDNIDDTFHAVGNGNLGWSLLSDGTLILSGTTQTLSGASTTAQGYCFPQAGGAAVMSRSGNPVLSIQRTTSDGAAVLFYRQTTNVGSISVTGAATAYNTSSDYRLKPNWERITESGAFIDSLIPRHGQWSIDGSYGAGFYAHELQEVSPSSVTGEKDAVDEEGKPVHQAVFYGSPEMIANMVAEMQDMRRRLYELENK